MKTLSKRCFPLCGYDFKSVLLLYWWKFLFLQTVSVSVSVLTLSCIALDRWYAICHPLMFKSTVKRARNSIVMIWIVSCIIMIPQAAVMECSRVFPGLANKTILFTVCDEHWGGEIHLPEAFPLSSRQAKLCISLLQQICHIGFWHLIVWRKSLKSLFCKFFHYPDCHLLSCYTP